MSISYKIILTSWLKSFLVVSVVLYSLVSIGEIVNGLLQGYDFTKILQNFLIKLPSFSTKIIPIITLTSGFFSLKNLRNQSELVSLVSIGFGKDKLLLLFAYIGLLFSLIQFINVSYFSPLSYKLDQQWRNEKNQSGRVYDDDLYWFKSKDYMASFKAFDAKKYILFDLSVYYFDSNFIPQKFVKAKSASFVEEQGWTAKNVISFDDISSKNRPKIINKKEGRIRLDQSAKDFINLESDIKGLEFFELSRFVNKLRENGVNVRDYENLIYEKWAMIMTTMIFSLLPLALLSSISRRQARVGFESVSVLMSIVVYFLIFYVTQSTLVQVPAVLANFTVPFLVQGLTLFYFYRNKNV